MKDKQMLELAAKAAGVVLAEGTTRIVGTMQTWRPLTDDGDRYRLARQLKFVVDFELHIVQCEINDKPVIFQWGGGGGISEEKAFVYAAAEIGKTLKD